MVKIEVRPLDLLGYSMALGLSILLLGLFFTAFAFGGTVTVTLTVFREQWIEAVLLVLFVMPILSATYARLFEQL